MTGKRSVLLSLGRLCGRVCIILLTRAQFLQNGPLVFRPALSLQRHSVAALKVWSDLALQTYKRSGKKIMDARASVHHLPNNPASAGFLFFASVNEAVPAPNAVAPLRATPV
jgi:hypothetical protein